MPGSEVDQDYFLARRDLIFAHRAFAALEILALPAALSLPLFVVRHPL